MPKDRSPRSAKVTVMVTPSLKTQLETEAWEEQRSVSDYVFGLLLRRGKWARTMADAGGYDLMVPAKKGSKSDR